MHAHVTHCRGKTFNTNTDVISGVSVYVIDCWETPASTVAAMKAKGLFPVGYFSAGSWENWRADKAAFPTVALGKALDGWAGEKWLDVRNSGVRTVMTAVSGGAGAQAGVFASWQGGRPW